MSAGSYAANTTNGASAEVLIRRLLSLWVFFWFCVYYLVLFPVYWVVLLRRRPQGARIAHALNNIWGWVVLLAGFNRWRVLGRHYLPTHDPVIYVANHRSYLDIPLLQAALMRDFRFMAKASLGRVPLFGFMYGRLHIMVNRANPYDSARAAVAGLQLLRGGTSVCIFPEGTTQHAEVLGPFREGAFTLACKAQVPIVPIVHMGTEVALSPDGRFLCWPARLSVTIGPPISPGGKQPEQLAAEVRHWMLQVLRAQGVS